MDRRDLPLRLSPGRSAPPPPRFLLPIPPSQAQEARRLPGISLKKSFYGVLFYGLVGCAMSRTRGSGLAPAHRVYGAQKV
jgi:hypothetical protein